MLVSPNAHQIRDLGTGGLPGRLTGLAVSKLREARFGAGKPGTGIPQFILQPPRSAAPAPLAEPGRDPAGDHPKSRHRDHHDRAITLSPSRGTLTVLVEDQGRVDYGPRIGEPKGMIGPVRLNGDSLRRWSVLPLRLPSLEAVRSELDASGAAVEQEPERLAGPVFARATFELDGQATLFLDTTGWGKGVAWVNGFCLGRYWSRGPQTTLFVPGPVLRRTGNEVILFELNSSAQSTIAFVPQALLGHTEE